jgi:pyruvate/2-oxoglutarate dehydrogenase complex dihydrolipoamide acyltransferase (E2) component
MEFLMPKLDHLSEDAIVTKWLKSEGDAVQKGEVILQVETNKALLDVEADRSGILTKIYHFDGDTVPVLEKIADIS